MLRSRRWYEPVARDTGTSRKRNQSKANQSQEKPVASKPVARETSRKQTNRKRNQSQKKPVASKPVAMNRMRLLVMNSVSAEYNNIYIKKTADRRRKLLNFCNNTATELRTMQLLMDTNHAST
ncbi:hormone receptor 4-like [Dorcoceras hygrometricum]|uniref:Hormone receptor 4-like n=1 Tax=Dorcoceras hygrometricum TaxID=472368 RepID=A0A2Z7C4G2_9LAMI|nr:hormone receptor 4-like [Dorcoceras hygrometricum]